MHGSPPPPAQRVTKKNWDSPPFNRWSFQHVREILPTATVWCGPGPASTLHEAPQDLDGLSLQTGDAQPVTLASFLEESFTDGFLVAHRGAIIYERYLNGMTPHVPHLAQSVSKSITATLAGVLMGRGLIDPDAPVEAYVPEFATCGYNGATVQQCLDMRSGVKFEEVYTDPDSEVGMLDRASGWHPLRAPSDPGNVFECILQLKQARPHGGNFEYRSVETDVLAFCMERATGKRLATLVSEELWQPLGAEEDAYFTVDPAGYALADGGMNATLRDYARFGLMHLDGGKFNDRQIVPASWIADCPYGDHAAFGDAKSEVLPDGAYHNKFWIENTRSRTYMALGVFGQMIYIAPDMEFLAVKFSTWPEFLSDARSAATLRVLHTIRAELTAGG